MDEEGREILRQIDPSNGNVLSVTEVVGVRGNHDDVVTHHSYTPQGLIDIKVDPLGRVTDYNYDALGRVTQVTYALGTPRPSRCTFRIRHSRQT